MCKVCKGRHPTVLHGSKIQKYKKKGNNEDIGTKENKPKEVKCTSTNTESDVVKICVHCSCTNQIKGYKQNSSHLCTSE